MNKISQIAARHGVKVSADMLAGVEMKPLSGLFRHVYEVECFDKDGNLKWTDKVENIYVNTGLDRVLDRFWKGSGYTAAHYVGLLSSTPTVAAGDTEASHGGWTEVTAYLNSPDRRPTLTLGTVSGQSVSNTLAKAIYAINGSATVGGAFLSTSFVKGGPSPLTSAVLIAGGAFTGGNKAVGSGDTLNVTVTLTAATA